MTYIEWAALGTFLFLLELFVPGTYLIWFGIAGLLMGVQTYFYDMTITMQLADFSVMSIVSATVGFYVYRACFKKSKDTDHPLLNDLAAQMVGKKVTVLQDAVNGETKVKVGDSVWIAVTSDALKEGDEAIVCGTKKGVVLVIKSV